MADHPERKGAERLLERLKQRAARRGADGEFDQLAAELRRLTARRKQTPSERLLREARRKR